MDILDHATQALRASFPSVRTLVLFHPPQELGLPAPYAWELLDEHGSVLAARGPWTSTPPVHNLVMGATHLAPEDFRREAFWIHIGLR